MTDKCRMRMNGREEYITTEITQRKREGEGGQEEERGLEKGRRLLCDREGLGIPVLERGVPFSLGRWAARFWVFFTPKISRHLIRAQLLGPISTNSLYWTRSENRDPTIGAVCGEVICATMSAIAC